VVDGKPYVKGLEDFGRAALEDIWEAVQQLFVEVSLIKTNEKNCFHQLYFIWATHCLKQHLK